MTLSDSDGEVFEVEYNTSIDSEYNDSDQDEIVYLEPPFSGPVVLPKNGEIE